MAKTLRLWQRIRKLQRRVADGLPPARAFDLVGLPSHLADHPTVQRAIAKAEAASMLRWLSSVNDATEDRIHYEYQWQDLKDGEGPKAPREKRYAAAYAGGPRDGLGGPANLPARARAWTQKADWKASITLLERRFPREFGAVATPDVGSQVATVIRAMAELRASVADQPAKGLPRELIAKPRLAIEDHARSTDGAPTHAREGEDAA